MRSNLSENISHQTGVQIIYCIVCTLPEGGNINSNGVVSTSKSTTAVIDVKKFIRFTYLNQNT